MDQHPSSSYTRLDYLSSSYFLEKKKIIKINKHIQGPDIKFTQAKSISTTKMEMARNQSASFFNERPHN